MVVVYSVVVYRYDWMAWLQMLIGHCPVVIKHDFSSYICCKMCITDQSFANRLIIMIGSFGEAKRWCMCFKWILLYSKMKKKSYHDLFNKLDKKTIKKSFLVVCTTPYKHVKIDGTNTHTHINFVKSAPHETPRVCTWASARVISSWTCEKCGQNYHWQTTRCKNCSNMCHRSNIWTGGGGD